VTLARLGLLVLLAPAACSRGGGPALVVAEVHRLENDPSRKVEVEKATLDVLPGLDLYHANVLIPDHPGHRCAVRDRQVWCDDAMLVRIVDAYSLGARPAQLTDAQWVDLAAFLLRMEPLHTAGTARHLDRYLSPEARREIHAPTVERTAEGVLVKYVTEAFNYMAGPSGPSALLRVYLRVAPDNTVKLETLTLWENGATR
jgi:hypothetical protein